jgi:hypothetical protein
MDKRSENFTLQAFHSYLQVIFTCRKIVRNGASDSTSHPKEVVLWIFICLKNPLPQSGLNMRPLDSMASTLTTTPPRRLRYLKIQHTDIMLFLAYYDILMHTYTH